MNGLCVAYMNYHHMRKVYSSHLHIMTNMSPKTTQLKKHTYKNSLNDFVKEQTRKNSKSEVKKVRKELRTAGFNNRVLIDCSHGNSNGDYKKQIDIFKDVTSRIEKGEKGIIGLMMEVYLDEGQQKIKLGVPGAPELVKPRISVTDKCLSFAEFKSAFEQVLKISK